MFKIPPNPWEGQQVSRETFDLNNEIVPRTNQRATPKKVMTGGAIDPAIFPKQLSELNVLWKNGNYYLSVGEVAGALMSFSNYAVYAHVLIMQIGEAPARAEGAAAEESPAAAARAARVSVPEGSTVEGAEGIGDAKAALDKTMQIALGYVETLQTKLSAITRGEEKGKEVEDAELCIEQTKDIIVEFKGKDCITFNDIVGLAKEKETIKDSFVRPIIYKRLYGNLAKGLLLYGPPGTGKTLLAKASATQLQLENENVRLVFLAPTGASLKGKYVGETEKNILRAFRCASVIAENCETQNKDGKEYLAVLFIDEFDSIAGDRSTDTTGLVANSVNTLLQVIDGVISFPNVVLIAATNYPWNLDAAILRRFDQQLLLDYPSFEMVRDIAFKVIRAHYFRPYWEELKKKERKIFEKKQPCEFHCGIPQTGVVYDENVQPFVDFVYDFRSKNVQFQALCDQLYSDKYSNSDVDKVVKLAIRQASSKALKYPFIPGNFFETKENKGLLNKSYISVFSKQENNKVVDTVTQMLIDINNEDYGSIYLDKGAYDETGFMKAIVYDKEVYFNTKLMLDLPSEFYLEDSEITDYFMTRKTANELKNRTNNNVPVTLIFSKDMKVSNVVPPKQLNFTQICRILDMFVNDPEKLVVPPMTIDVSKKIEEAKTLLRMKSTPPSKRVSDFVGTKPTAKEETQAATAAAADGIYFQKQVGDMSCGRRAMNNALQDTYFEKNSSNPKDEAALDIPPSPANKYGLHQLMDLLLSEFAKRLRERGEDPFGNPQIENFQWRESEHYDLQFIHAAMELAGWELDSSIQSYKRDEADGQVDALTDAILADKKIILLTPGGVGHYVSFYRKEPTGAAPAYPEYYLLDSMADAPRNLGGILALKQYIKDQRGLYWLSIFKPKEGARTPFPEIVFANLLEEERYTKQKLAEINKAYSDINAKVQNLPGNNEKKILLKGFIENLRSSAGIDSKRYIAFLKDLALPATVLDFDLSKDEAVIYDQLIQKLINFSATFVPVTAGGARDFIENLDQAYQQNVKTDAGKTKQTFTGDNILFLEGNLGSTAANSIDDFATYFKNYTRLNDSSYMMIGDKEKRKQTLENIQKILEEKIFAILKMPKISYTTFYIVSKFIVYSLRRMYKGELDMLLGIKETKDGFSPREEASKDIQNILVELDKKGLLLPGNQYGLTKIINDLKVFDAEIWLRDDLEKRKTKQVDVNGIPTTVDDPKSVYQYLISLADRFQQTPINANDTGLERTIRSDIRVNDKGRGGLIYKYFTGNNEYRKKFEKYLKLLDQLSYLYALTYRKPNEQYIDPETNKQYTKPELALQNKEQEVRNKYIEILRHEEQGVVLDKGLVETGLNKIKGFFGYRGGANTTRKQSKSKSKRSKTLKGGSAGTAPLLYLEQYFDRLRNIAIVQEEDDEGRTVYRENTVYINLLKDFMFPNLEAQENTIDIETIADEAIKALTIRRYNTQFFFVCKFQTNSEQWRPTYYVNSRVVKDFLGKNTPIDFGKLQGEKSSLFKFLITRSTAIGFLSYGDDLTGRKMPPRHPIKWYDFVPNRLTYLNNQIEGLLERYATAAATAKAMEAAGKLYSTVDSYVKGFLDSWSATPPTADAAADAAAREVIDEAAAAQAASDAAAQAASDAAADADAAAREVIGEAAAAQAASDAAAAQAASDAAAAAQAASDAAAQAASAVAVAGPPGPPLLLPPPTVNAAPPTADAAARAAAARAAAADTAADAADAAGEAGVFAWFRSLPSRISNINISDLKEKLTAENFGLVVVNLFSKLGDILANWEKGIKAIGKAAILALIKSLLTSIAVAMVGGVMVGGTVIEGLTVSMVVLGLFAFRKLSQAGYNYYLETSNTNFLALHTGLIIAFEGKTDLFGDFTNEENLVNNLGDQLKKIIENGLKQSSQELEISYSDPDQSLVSKVTKKVYGGLKWVLSNLLSIFWRGLFKIGVPYQTYYIENVPRSDKLSDATGESLDKQLEKEVEKYNILNDSQKLQKDQKEIEILHLLERILKGNQSPDKFLSFKTNSYEPFFDKYIEKRSKELNSMLNRLNAARDEYLKIMERTAIDESMKLNMQKIKTGERKVELSKFLAKYDDLLLIINLIKEIKKIPNKTTQEQSPPQTSSQSAKKQPSQREKEKQFYDSILQAKANLESAEKAYQKARSDVAEDIDAKDSDDEAVRKVTAVRDRLNADLEANNLALTTALQNDEVIIRLIGRIQAESNRITELERLVNPGDAASPEERAAYAEAQRELGEVRERKERLERDHSGRIAALPQTAEKIKKETEFNAKNKQLHDLTTAIPALKTAKEANVYEFLDAIQTLYRDEKTELGNTNFLLVNVNKLGQSTPRNEILINLNLPLSCFTEAITLFPSNYDKKIHDDLVAYNTNKNKFLEAYRTKQKKTS